MKVKDIHEFFEDLNRRIDHPIQILLTGGAAAILQGVQRATFDIDFEIRLGARAPIWNAVQKAIEETARTTGITPQYSEDIAQWSSIAMPPKRSRLYRRFGTVEVRILDPGLWAIGKLARYLSTDIEDLRIVLKTAGTRSRAMVKLWGTALGISPASSSQGTFRRQVENFLDQYAREIWGRSEDPAKLKQLFIKTAQNTQRRRE